MNKENQKKLIESNPLNIMFIKDPYLEVQLMVVKKYGYKVPGDIAIIGFTNGQIAMLTDPGLSSVEQHGREIGENAARLLIDRLTKKETYPSITKVIETQLVKRESSLR